MCESGHFTVATTLKTAVDAEQVVESQADTVQGLFSAAARVKTMPARPAIERSSIMPGVVVVDNSQGIFQLIGPKGKVFVPRRVLLDSGAQPLMLGASAIEGHRHGGQVIRCLGRVDGFVPYGVHFGLLERDSEL
jgi:hypothetical protein